MEFGCWACSLAEQASPLDPCKWGQATGLRKSRKQPSEMTRVLGSGLPDMQEDDAVVRPVSWEWAQPWEAVDSYTPPRACGLRKHSRQSSCWGNGLVNVFLRTVTFFTRKYLLILFVVLLLCGSKNTGMRKVEGRNRCVLLALHKILKKKNNSKHWLSSLAFIINLTQTRDASTERPTR